MWSDFIPGFPFPLTVNMYSHVFTGCYFDYTQQWTVQHAKLGHLMDSTLPSLCCSSRCCGAFRGLCLYLNITEHHIWVCADLLKSVCVFFPRMSQNAWNISTKRRCQGGGVLHLVLPVSASASLTGGDAQPWSIFILISNTIFSNALFMPCYRNKNAKYLHQVPLCNSLWYQPSHCRLFGLLFPAKRWRWSREKVVCWASGWCDLFVSMHQQLKWSTSTSMESL